MELLLKVIAPNGDITLLPLADGRIELDARPGSRYQLILDAPGAGLSPRVMRLGDDLVVDRLGTGEEIQITGFFTACPAGNVCRFEVYLDGDNVAAATVTPGSEPVAAITGGGFLMAEPGVPPGALPAPPEAEAAPFWRPVLAGGAGLLVLAGAAGSGGEAGDVAPPATPVIASSGEVNVRFPEIRGTAEAGSQVSVILTLPDGARVAYATEAAADGSWSVATGTAAPSSGALPADGLPENSVVGVEVVARDLAGNLSSSARGTIAVDARAPDAATFDATGDLAADGGRVVLNQNELADGLTIAGRAEAGATVTLALSDSGLERQTTAGADGRYSLTLGDSGLALADGSYTLRATVTDAAGNQSPASTLSLEVDRTLSPIRAEFGEVIDDRAPLVGELPAGMSSNDPTPALRGALAGSLATDEQLLVLLDGNPLGAATVQPGSWQFSVDTPLADGAHVFTLQLVDAAGNAAAPGSARPRTLTIDTDPPDQRPTIATVLDDDGPDSVQVGAGGTTDDPTPRVRISLDGLLGGGESVIVQRTHAGTVIALGPASAVDGDATGRAFELTDTSAPAGVNVYEARVVDAAGLAGPLSAAYAIQIIAPPSASESL